MMRVQTRLILLSYVLLSVSLFAACSSDERRISENRNAEAEKIRKEKEAQRAKSLKATFTGHSAPVKQVIFTPDGKNVVSAAGLPSAEGEINVWEVETGAIRASYKLGSSFDRAAFSPDARYCAVTGKGLEGKIELWEIGTKRPFKTIELGPKLRATALNFSSDGQFLAAAITEHPYSGDGTPFRYDDFAVRIWDVQNGSQKVNTSSAKWGGYSVSFSPDSKLIASNSDKNVVIWDSASGKLTTTLNGANLASLVTAVQFGNLSGFVATGDFHGNLKVWDISASRAESILNDSLHSGTVLSISWSRDGKHLVVGYKDGEIGFYQTALGKAKHIITIKPDNAGDVSSLAFSSDSRYVAAGLEDKTVKTWDLTEFQIEDFWFPNRQYR